MENVLRGVVAYVDVKSPFGNSAIALTGSLEALGARVCHSLNHLVTHVIFRNGSEVVRSWAIKRNIPVVSPAWVKASRMMKVKAPEAAYSEKEDKNDLSGLSTKLDSVADGDVEAINRIGVPISDREYNNGLSVFKPIRVSEKFIRPKTPPGMRDFLLRIQKGRKLNGEDTICDEAIPKNSEDNIENETRNPTVGEGFQNSNVKSKADCLITSTQNTTDQPEVLEFRNSLSPIIINESQNANIIIEDSIINDSLIENYPDTTNLQQKVSSKFHLINPNVDSPTGELIVPKIKQKSHLLNEIYNQSKKLRRKSSGNNKRISISAPLTPDVLLDFVSSTHSTKSVNTKKNNSQSVDNNLASVQQQQQLKKSNLLTYKKSTKLFSNLKNSPSVTPKLCSKKTPIQKQSRQSTHNSQLRSKSITEEKTNNNQETKNLLALSNRKQNVNSSKDVSTQQRKRSRSALCTQTLRPVIVPLPSTIDSEATTNNTCLQKSESLSKQQEKSTQTLMVSNPIHKTCGLTKELLPDNHYKGKPNINEITPLSTTPKRLSVSQIKTINKRSSLEEFRSTPQTRRKEMSIRSPAASEIGATRISIPPGLPRLSRMQNMNRLFSNVGIIYVGLDTKPPRQDLVNLLNLGGAVLTNKKTEATILIGCHMLNKICIQPNWILDSIFQAKLLALTNYEINLDQSVCRLLGLKIKLVRRKTPCLALELEQSSVTGHPRSVWHFIPVQVVSIFFPPVKTLRPFVDRMKKFAKFIIISANGSGELNFAVNVETLASVKLTFRGLKSRSWMNTESFSTEINDSMDEARSTIWDSNNVDLDSSKQINNEDPNKKLVSISLDLRRIGQLLSSPRIVPSCFVCNIKLQMICLDF
ncbi:mitotic and DNA damage checkpoint protein hus1,putative [Schistosoma mansoni]|uniref:mitotic and DNA damage checkpoint protein hus1,putative n=1 Tax=Schistosoma mansoni TaxID=6183 RepID=UPI00022C813C|nr:mitotic and DNA damage checkpoint protein hus1,putative [Schistosoma mansoni]|eukprot:XP_018645563.1 mitotic and DNA damage checkpoint protein hus1,putative [Schistosoma mansoni]